MPYLYLEINRSWTARELFAAICARLPSKERKGVRNLESVVAFRTDMNNTFYVFVDEYARDAFNKVVHDIGARIIDEETGQTVTAETFR